MLTAISIKQGDNQGIIEYLTESHAQAGFKHLQRWRPYSLSGQAVPVLCLPLSVTLQYIYIYIHIWTHTNWNFPVLVQHMRTGPKQCDYCTVHLPFIQDYSYLGLPEAQKINTCIGSLGHEVILGPLRHGLLLSCLWCFQAFMSADGLRVACNHMLTVLRSSLHNLASLHTHCFLSSSASPATYCTLFSQPPHSFICLPAKSLMLGERQVKAFPPHSHTPPKYLTGLEILSHTNLLNHFSGVQMQSYTLCLGL